MPILPQNIPLQNLQLHLDTAALRAQLLAQIAKDLAVDSLEIDPADGLFFDKLYQYIFGFLENLLAHAPQKLGELLYRVDLAEQKAQKFLVAENAIQAFAEGILQREMLKIVIRNVHNGTLQL